MKFKKKEYVSVEEVKIDQSYSEELLKTSAE